jgi:hypothetical protein
MAPIAVIIIMVAGRKKEGDKDQSKTGLTGQPVGERYPVNTL